MSGKNSSRTKQSRPRNDLVKVPAAGLQEERKTSAVWPATANGSFQAKASQAAAAAVDPKLAFDLGMAQGGYGLARKTSRQSGSQRATTSAKPSGFGPGER